MSARLVKALIIAYSIACLAFQLRLSTDWVLRESLESERARRPFTVRNFDFEGKVDIVFPSARDAGLRKGDRIIQVDGQPYTGAGSYYRALERHQSGEILRILIQREGETQPRQFALPLRSSAPEGESWTPADIVYLGISQIATPLLALGLGLFVLVRSPLNALSLVVFAFLVSFSVMATGGLSLNPIRMVCQWEPPLLRSLALFHMASWLYQWPILLLVFAIYFPHRSEWDQRYPWITGLLVAPVIAHALLRGIAFPAGVEALPTHHGLVQFADSFLSNRTFAYFAAVCVVAAFIESLRKLRAANNPDSQRRLRILLSAMVISWTPFLFAIFAQDLFNIRYRGWPEIVSICLLLVFPVALVYLIFVDRAMELGVTIREGLQYAAARRGLYVVQFLVVFGLVIGLGISLGEPDLRLPQRMQRVAVGIGAAMFSRRLVEKAGKWLDRRFFREQYQAGQLLTELAQQAGETADRSKLRELITSRISATLHTSTVHLIDQETSEFAGTLSRLSNERKPQWIDWRRPGEWVNALDSPENSRLQQLKAELILPVARQDRLLGFLALGPRLGEQPYSTSDVAVLESVASQTALALDNARLAETVAHESASREIINRELQIAREVQERLLPRAAPAIPGLDVAGLCVPAREVGGDLFDYVPLPNGEWAIAVGDVAGKGVSAALIMASLQASVRGLSATGIADLPELMTRLNRLTYDSTPANRFATFQIGVFDPAGRRLRFCGAGHNPALHIKPATGEIAWLRPKGVALGLVKQSRFEQIEVALGPGDWLLFYTDGVTEAMNPERELFGEDRLEAWAKTVAPNASSSTVAQDLAAKVAAFAAAAPQHDDITIIVLR